MTSHVIRSLNKFQVNVWPHVRAGDLIFRSALRSSTPTERCRSGLSGGRRSARRRGGIRMLDAIVHAEMWRLRARVIICRLDSGHAGESDVQGRIVWVSDRLTPIEARCTVMHELAHIELGHIPTGDPDHDDPLEAEADEWAAVRLISDCVFAHARDISHDEREMAEHCGVDPNTMAARLRIADRLVPAHVMRLVRP